MMLPLATSTGASSSHCDLYLAPSTLPNAGLGVFAGRPLEPGDKLGHGDPCIPVLDLEWHSGMDPDFVDPFWDYVWSGSALGMSFEAYEMELVTGYCPGLGSAVNFHPILNNLQRSIPDYSTDQGGQLHRFQDATSGSSSPYHSPHNLVTSNVPVGGELFTDYGDTWLEERTENLPLLKISNVPAVQGLLREFGERVPKSKQQTVHGLLQAFKPIWGNPPILEVLPEDWNSMQTMLGGGNHALWNLHQPNSTRSVEWLTDHGSCIDRIVSGPSTLGAGRGAFARQHLPKDEVITTSPLIAIPNRTLLEMHDIKPLDKDPSRYTKLRKLGDQLLLNYCFGNGHTTVLLCPYAPGVNYLNHNKTMANVRLEWASNGFLQHNDDWLATPPTKWNVSSQHAHLALHFIATRDILPGEELFLDYGPAWELAWEKHAATWSQRTETGDPEIFQDYVSAEQWNRQYQHKEPLWTEVELNFELSTRGASYPDNLELRCHSGLLGEKHYKYSKLTWEGDPSRANDHPEYGRPCRVLDRRNVTDKNGHTDPQFVYQVSMTGVTDYTTGETLDMERFDIPRSALRWFDKPHTTALHLTAAFRHEIGLPDSLVPEAWKTLTGEDQTTGSHADNGSQDTCGLYLAPSSIPGAGLGVFAGRLYNVGEDVGNGDVAIPLLELSWHTGYYTNEVENYFDPTADYVWDGKSLGLANEVSSRDISMYWPGINCAVNCYAPLINLDPSSPVYDEAGVHRQKHPGAGAFTPYHLGISKATRIIPAGGELFKNYGDQWFTSRRDYEGLPTVTDVTQAQTLLGPLTSHNTSRFMAFDLVSELRKVWNSGTLNALPTTKDGARDALQNDIGTIHQPNRTRDVLWLQSHGRCIDNIVPERSTLPGAGHGAFSKRFLPGGSVIGGSPLHHMRRPLLDMFKFEYLPGDEFWHRGELSSRQLLVNYCYGNIRSELLLCPYSSGVNYINHNQTLANVKVQWAPNGTMGHNSSWFDIPPSEMEYVYRSNLAFDYVALRDIFAGEEIFLDYGDEWEHAWLEHVKQWSPLEEWMEYHSAAFHNTNPSTVILRTTAEEDNQEQTCGDNVSLHCHSSLATNTSEELEEHRMTLNWNKQEYYDWTVYSVDYGHHCRVLKRHESDLGYTYDVTMEVTDDDGVPVGTVSRENVPREAIRFFDRPYTTDMHLESGFRHEIGIPPDMVPKAWEDRKKSGQRVPEESQAGDSMTKKPDPVVKQVPKDRKPKGGEPLH